MDIVSPDKRSLMMSGIKGKNTKPEMLLRKELFRRGFRYRLHGKDLPGKPDLIFTKYKAVILVHGCFWHCHDCRLFKWPKSNRTFWEKKILSNVQRDKKNLIQLNDRGWKVLTLWECAIKKTRNIDKVIDNVSYWLLNEENNYEISEGIINDIN